MENIGSIWLQEEVTLTLPKTKDGKRTLNVEGENSQALVMKRNRVASTENRVFFAELLSLRQLNIEAELLFLIILEFKDVPEFNGSLFLL